MAKQLQHALNHALVLHKAGRIASAVTCYQHILTALPRHPQANSRLGLLLMETGRTKVGVKYLRTAVQAEPKVALHWLRLLAALQQLGDVQAAQDVLAQAVKFNLPIATMEQLARIASEPPDKRQRCLLMIYQSGRNLLTAEIAARLFIDDYPEHPLGWQILSALLHDTGKLDESLEVKRATVERFPNDANAHSNLAYTFLALQRYEEALKSARAAIKLNPSLTQAWAHEQQALAGISEKRNELTLAD